MAFQEPLDVFFSDFNNNENGQSVLFYPVAPGKVEAWLSEGNTAIDLSDWPPGENAARKGRCYIRFQPVLTENGDLSSAQEEPVLELRSDHSAAIGLAARLTIDGEGRRFRLVSSDQAEGLVTWKMAEAPGVAGRAL